MRRVLPSLLAITAALIASAAPASERSAPASAFPNRPIRIVVGFTPGGQPDISARAIAVKLTEKVGQQVVIDNRPGAGGTIGSRIVAEGVFRQHRRLSR